MSTIKVKIIGVGNRGCNVLNRLNDLPKSVKRIAIAKREKVFEGLEVNKKIELTQVDIDNPGQAIDSKKSQIEKILDNTDIGFFISNLTNKVTVTQTATIAQLARQKGILTVFVGASPFFFEGKLALEQSEQNKAYLHDEIDSVLVLDSDKTIQKGVPIAEGLTKVDNMLSGVILSIIDLINKCGVINVDFADLRSTIENGGELFFNSISGTKEDLTSIVNQLFTNTQLKSTKTDFSRSLYVIYSNSDLLMQEVGDICNKIQKQLTNKARIIFGVVNDAKIKQNLKIVLLAN
ncbi:hypothetical protein HN858_03945 [Candidatus Falkowbacteria bacterium]|nr:hypothetical protein [Candidatus Falkowbacteria bacterium]